MGTSQDNIYFGIGGRGREHVVDAFTKWHHEGSLFIHKNAPCWATPVQSIYSPKVIGEVIPHHFPLTSENALVPDQLILKLEHLEF